ncbi:MAG: hypothetical protein JWN00_4534 [Actinomycetia bacterium]|nr:hypothetical protein [Actinomycetes bacterium]
MTMETMRRPNTDSFHTHVTPLYDPAGARRWAVSYSFQSNSGRGCTATELRGNALVTYTAPIGGPWAKINAICRAIATSQPAKLADALG